MLKCDLHDYIEIACLYKYQLELILLNGDIYHGQASNVKVKSTHDGKKEYLYIHSKDNQELEINIINIKSIEAKNEGAKFSKIDFN